MLTAEIIFSWKQRSGKCGTGPSLQEKRSEATRSQLRRAKQLGKALTQYDATDEDRLTSVQDDPPTSPNSYRHNVSIDPPKLKSMSGNETVVKDLLEAVFIDRLETAKREKEQFKLKSLEPYTLCKKVYTLVNCFRELVLFGTLTFASVWFETNFYLPRYIFDYGFDLRRYNNKVQDFCSLFKMNIILLLVTPRFIHVACVLNSYANIISTHYVSAVLTCVSVVVSV